MKRSPKNYLIMAVVLALTLVFSMAARSIVMDNDVKIFFPKDHQSYIRTKALDKTYGSQVIMDICVSTQEDSILSWENLNVISTLISQIEELENVQSVSGLTNTDYPVGTAEGMSVYSLLPEGEEQTPQNLLALKERLLDWSDIYARTLYSDDFKSTQILVLIDDSIGAPEQEVIYHQIMTLIEPYNYEPLSLVVAGHPVTTQMCRQYMYTDLFFLIPFVVVVLFLCLFFSFRRLSATILPLLTVLVATIWTVGIMALFQVSFTIISSCLPVLIIAVGSAYGIHVINHYYHVKEASISASVRENLRTTLKEVMLPILLAGFTTLVGFLSIISSPVVPMKGFGAFAALGTLFSLILSMIFIPAVLEISENRHKLRMEHKEPVERKNSVLLLSIHKLTETHKKSSVTVLLLLTGLSIWGLINLNVESSIIGYLPYDSEIRQDSRYISDNFAGTNTFNIVFSAQEGKDLTDPEVLKSMDDLKTHLLETYPEEVGKIISYSDFIKRMNQVMNYPDAEAGTANDFDDADAFASSDSLGMDSFFGDTSTADSAVMGSFFDDTSSGESVGLDSFFDESSSGDSMEMGSFFDTPVEDTVVKEAPEFVALDQQMEVQDLILMFQDSFTASGKAEISVEELNLKLREMTNYRGAAYYEIPSDINKYPVNSQQELQNLISQYLLLYSGSLDDYTNDSLKPTEARMLVQLKTYNTSVTETIINDIEQYTKRNVPQGYTVHNAGIAELELALTNMITSAQITSIALALIAVFLIIAVSFKSPLAGVIGIIPLSISILVNFGLMSLLKINLDMITSLIASIAIGIGVDYTVHFLSRYKRERSLSDDLSLVSKITILSTGRGIIINAVSVGLGFAVLIFSRFLVLRYIGLLVAVIMVTSSMGALIILPLILNKLDPKFMRADRVKSNQIKKSAS